MKAEKKKAESLGNHHSILANKLIANKKKAQEIIKTYNNLPCPTKKELREKIIRELFGSIGNNFNIEQPFFCDYGHNIYIGENFYANSGCVLHDTTQINIGNEVMLGPNVKICTESYHLDVKQNNVKYTYPISIGNNVWIGGNVVILPGVTIGDNAFIITGSIVYSNIPPNAFASGNPAKVIKYIEEYENDE